MDAAQLVQLVPAVQTLTVTANQAPMGADSGAETPSPLFRMMLAEAAGAVGSRETPSQVPSELLQPVGRRAVPLRFARAAEGRQLPGKGAAEPESAVTQERKEVETGRTGRKAAALAAEEREGILAAVGSERELLTDGRPLWEMAGLPMMENRQPLAGLESLVTDDPSAMEGGAATAATGEFAPLVEAGQGANPRVILPGLPVTRELPLSGEEQGGTSSPGRDAVNAPSAVLPKEKEMPATGIVLSGTPAVETPGTSEPEIPRHPGKPAFETEAIKLNMPAVGPRAVVEQYRDVQREAGQAAALFNRVQELGSTRVSDLVVPALTPGKTAEASYLAQQIAPAGIGRMSEETAEKQAVERVAGKLASGAELPFQGRSSVTSTVESDEAVGEQPVVGRMQENGTQKVLKGDREGSLKHHLQELKAELKGEAVIRQVPGGVVVSNQVRTAGTEAVSRQEEMIMPAAIQPGSTEPTEQVRTGEQAAPDVEAAGGLSGRKESFSFLGGRQYHNEAGTGEGANPVTANPAGFGKVEAAVPGTDETYAGRLSGEERERLHGEILSQVRERLENHNPGSGDGKITLRLNPRELGELQLNVRMEDRRMSIEVTAQNPVVKEALLQNLDQLKDTLSRQNIQMDRFEVATGTGQQGSGQSFREGRQSGNRQGGETPYPVAGYPREETAAVAAAGWEPREHSLVDMRF